MLALSFIVVYFIILEKPEPEAARSVDEVKLSDNTHK